MGFWKELGVTALEKGKNLFRGGKSCRRNKTCRRHR